MGYTEACASAAANTNIVATGGIDTKGITGYYKRVFWVAAGSSFASVTAMKDKANWDALVAAGNAIYLGQIKTEDQSAEATFFEDNALGIREKQTEATKVVRAVMAICACSHAELKKMEGKEGTIFFETSKNFGIGRLQEDGSIKGRAVSSIVVGQRSVPTTEQPVEYTTIDFTFSDNDGDEKNPAEVKLGFLFSEVDQVFPVDGVVSSVSSNGTTLSFTLKLTKDCSTDVLGGVVVGDLKAVDEDGNVLTVATATESPAGTYAVGITTALTLAYVSFNGIRDVASGGVLYYMDTVTVST